MKISDDLDYHSFLDRLRLIFEGMDSAYAGAAAHYGFDCKGCEDNCCLTRFYHHTLLEYLYIKEGLDALDPDVRAMVGERAGEVIRETAEVDARGETPRILCPLNENGLCILYERRPMICRLHGIPHELRRPGAAAIRAPGCDAFTSQCKDKAYSKFDRTPFYKEMAMLERELRRASGVMDKMKMTVAEMIERMNNR
ncbi:MAG: hypothetical protein GY859_09995 [Desulfobacterales bacterium]|nr:hypothetical protein [Desulfobacterales bacterium]